MDELKPSFSSFLTKITGIEKYFNDGKIILGGDFFHTKAAKICSSIGVVEMPYFLAVIEECLAKVALTFSVNQ
jgi:hypothetical protein